MSTANEDERGEIEMLLPWHAAGTLSPRETERVDKALARDPELARRYELVREELGQTIHLNETLGAPSPRVMEKLFTGIDAEPPRKPALSQTMAARVGEFFAGLSPRTLAWSASAAVVAILLQAGLIGGLVFKQNGESGYGTASAPATLADGTYALIRFAPQASAADITKFLETNKLSIADGPAPGGLYRVRIAGTKLPRAEVSRIVKTLQINPVVGMIAMPE
jgi:hypothetical protein